MVSRNKARFKTYLYGELKELFANLWTNRDVWFDGTWDRKVWTSDDGKALERLHAHRSSSSVILDNRSGLLPPQRKLDIAVANFLRLRLCPATIFLLKVKCRPLVCRELIGKPCQTMPVAEQLGLQPARRIPVVQRFTSATD